MKIRATEAWFDETIVRIDKGDINEELVADICLLKNQSTQTLQHCANEAVQFWVGWVLCGAARLSAFTAR